MIKVPTDLLSGEGSSWFIDRHLHKEPSHNGRGEGPLRISFMRGSIPFVRASPSRPSHLPKALLPNTIMLGLGFQHTNLGVWGANANIQSITPCHIPALIWSSHVLWHFLSVAANYLCPLIPVTDDINLFSICIHYALISLSFYSLLTLNQSAADPLFGCKHQGV